MESGSRRASRDCRNARFARAVEVPAEHDVVHRARRERHELERQVPPSGVGIPPTVRSKYPFGSRLSAKDVRSMDPG